MSVQILAEYIEYLDVEKGLSQNTTDAYRRDLSEFWDFCSSSVRFLPIWYNIEKLNINIDIK